MSAFDLWPFTDVSTVERRGELQVLAGTSPDGLPVTITRLAPDTARDATLRQRFKDAVEAATRHTGPDDPPILWADTSTLVPWAATYDDPDHRGADLIGRIFETKDAGTPGEPTSHETMVQQQTDSEKSVPALDPNAYGSYDAPTPVHDSPSVPRDTPPPQYDSPRPVEHTTPRPQAPQQPPAQPPPSQQPPGTGDGGGGGGRGSRTPLIVGLGAGGLIVVLLLGSLVALAATRDRDTASDPGRVPTPVATTQSPTPTSHITTGPVGSGSASPSTGASDSAEPKLKDVDPVSVYGPTWQKGDSTYLMAFSQLGWAFRAPGDFDCLVREHTSKKTKVTCTKLFGKKSKSRRVLIVDRTCSGSSCSAKEQKKVEKDPWGRKIDNWKRADGDTKYVTGTFKNKDNKRKYFGYYMSHYYEDDKGHKNRHVLVYGDAPANSKYAKQIQKTVNSIRTQTG